MMTLKILSECLHLQVYPDSSTSLFRSFEKQIENHHHLNSYFYIVIVTEKQKKKDLIEKKNLTRRGLQCIYRLIWILSDVIFKFLFCILKKLLFMGRKITWELLTSNCSKEWHKINFNSLLIKIILLHFILFLKYTVMMNKSTLGNPHFIQIDALPQAFKPPRNK